MRQVHFLEFVTIYASTQVRLHKTYIVFLFDFSVDFFFITVKYTLKTLNIYLSIDIIINAY